MPVTNLIIEHVNRDKHLWQLYGPVNSWQRVFSRIDAVFVQLAGINFGRVGFLRCGRQGKAEN